MIVVLDSGPLYAAINTSEPEHLRCSALLRRTDLDVVLPTLCIGEVAYLIERDLGAEAEAAFIAGCVNLDVRHVLPADLSRMAELMRQYADFPLGAVDASVVALAERLGADTIATLDHRHFRVIRPKHVEAFTLVPEL